MTLNLTQPKWVRQHVIFRSLSSGSDERSTEVHLARQTVQNGRTHSEKSGPIGLFGDGPRMFCWQTSLVELNEQLIEWKMGSPALVRAASLTFT